MGRRRWRHLYDWRAARGHICHARGPHPRDGHDRNRDHRLGLMFIGLGIGIPHTLLRAASGPTLTVTGGVITPFNSGGVDYVEIAFTASGSFTLSGDVPTHNRALGAGGATGGRGTDITFYASAGRAGGLIEVIDAPLLAG